jgi:hypothetical protein
VVLQAVGAVSLLPYPAIIAANVMQIAAEGQQGFGRFTAALPYVLLSLYPAIWLGLYVWSWRAIAHGGAGRAFVLSSIPAVLSMAGFAWFLIWRVEDRKSDEARLEQLRKRVEAVNPLAWTIMRSGGPLEFPGAPLLPADAVIAEIDIATNINVPVGEYGTPLAIRKRWILWTPEGCYDASPGAEDLFGFEIGGGEDQPAAFTPAAEMRWKYYKPDAVTRALR